ncbi:MAG: hypothetical protein R3E96_08765 [Planctomycetota bacterium]
MPLACCLTGTSTTGTGFDVPSNLPLPGSPTITAGSTWHSSSGTANQTLVKLLERGFGHVLIRTSASPLPNRLAAPRVRPALFHPRHRRLC